MVLCIGVEFGGMNPNLNQFWTMVLNGIGVRACSVGNGLQLDFMVATCLAR